MANSMLHVNLRPRRGVREAQLHDLHTGAESLVGGSAGAGPWSRSSGLRSGRGAALPRRLVCTRGGQAVYVRSGRRCVECWGRCARVTAPHARSPQFPRSGEMEDLWGKIHQCSHKP